jgi:hypothetical protein
MRVIDICAGGFPGVVIFTVVGADQRARNADQCHETQTH